MKIYRVTQVVLATAVVGIATRLYAQSALPDPLDKLLSADAALAVVSVIGLVTAVKNLLPFIKGGWALVVTTIASIGIALVQNGVSGGSLAYGLAIGVASAYSFFVTKNYGNLRSFVSTGTPSGRLGVVIDILRYLLARRVQKVNGPAPSEFTE